MSSESQPYADTRQPVDDRLPVADRLDDDHFPAYTMGRAAELVDQGTPVEAACRIIGLEERLGQIERDYERLRRQDEHVVLRHQ
ncbi:hypothetical protein ACWZEH_16605 [Streptomyces sp. QTS137]